MKYELLTRIVLILCSVLFSYLLAVLGYSLSPEVGLYGTSQGILREADLTTNTLYAISGILFLSTVVSGVMGAKAIGIDTILTLSIGLGIAISLSIVSISWFMFTH
jgi:hypothetical protein